MKENIEDLSNQFKRLQMAYEALAHQGLSQKLYDLRVIQIQDKLKALQIKIQNHGAVGELLQVTMTIRRYDDHKLRVVRMLFYNITIYEAIGLAKIRAEGMVQGMPKVVSLPLGTDLENL